MLETYNAAKVVTPSDANTLEADHGAGYAISDALLVGGAGSLSVVMEYGGQVDLPAVPAGVIRLRVKQVRATGTAATGVVALYSEKS